MAEAFGGEHGGGITGRTIAVTGPLESSFGIPRIVVTSPSQIRILDEDPEN
jgi:hypothetical protein